AVGLGSLASDLAAHPRRVGYCMAGASVAILAEYGRRLVAGEVGEIAFRAPGAQMLGYYREAAITESTLVDGWVRSGDLGRIDGLGVHFEGRAKNVIK